MPGQLLNIGQLLDGRYRITKTLPPGGFGQTYIAEDIKRPGNPQCVEQFHGNPQFNSDIYALGMVAIQALTGLLVIDISKLRDPNNPSTGEVVWSHRAQQVSPNLVNVINKMVLFDCRQRYQSVSEVLKDLTKIDKPQPPPSSPRKTLWLILAGAAALIVVGVIFAFYNKPNTSGEQAVKTVREKANRGDYQGNIPSLLPQRQSPSASNQQAKSLSLNGQLVNDKLDGSDAVLPNNTYYKLYMFEGRANQQVSIEMTSQEIDPALILLNADGSELARNEDVSPGDFNSRIVATLPKDGNYIVLAISSQAQQSGTYYLQAKVSGSK
ncbi:pre-peptidase C-terminal domain-containing protein [Iningainema tapete]|uniref:Pre-peptidase C-terminal domain-containing protein n=1 Tax=Iningainema tapete BLCC-T55 TaxID=2748662 RepID=A0A8J6XJX1_9CYAN|nr:pre-peptidase C-terminal domain-containing protein [Iningainema tapete]MBD2777429.1 pre-peptidase C-terminal domain-containing protein [Iningainema tapete BLCC-T55]